MILGYARTSTEDQKAGLEAQIRDLRERGAERIWYEHISSMKDRPELNACLATLQAGDTLIVTKPDRLARSVSNLLDIVNDLDKRDIGLIVLSMGGQQLDTRNPTSRLILTILGSIAAWEREIMLERQREGINKAKAEGKYRGRTPTVRRQSEMILALRDIGMKAPAIAKKLNVGRSSVYRILDGTTT